MGGEGGGDLRGEIGQGGVVDAAGTRQVDVEDLADAAGIGREEDDAVAEADSLADVVRDEHDGLPALREDPLDVAVKLVAGEGVEGGERLVHQQHAGIRRETARERDALAHAAGELVGPRALPVGKTDELGNHAVENRFAVKNLHATILHQLGLDPERLSYFYNGLDQKLVGVEGAEPIRQLIS